MPQHSSSPIIVTSSRRGPAPLIFSTTEIGDSWQRCEQSDIDRFWSHVNQDGPTPEKCPELGPCFLWLLPPASTGYGQFWLGGKNWSSHRFSFLLHGGSLTVEKPFVLHHCDVRLCCRYDHLFAGSHQDNMDDARAKGVLIGRANTYHRGESHYAARLTSAQVDEIRNRPESSLELAPIYNVHSSTIRYLRAGRSWKENQ